MRKRRDLRDTLAKVSLTDDVGQSRNGLRMRPIGNLNGAIRLPNGRPEA